MSAGKFYIRGNNSAPCATFGARFSTLDAIRGIAAFCVVQYHASDLFGMQLASSYLAVDLFFLLSGLVLSNAYEQRLRNGLPLRTFIFLRIVRLYPLYAAGTIASLAFLLANHFLGRVTGPSLISLMPTLALALMFLPTPPNWFPGNIDIFPLLYPAWSLFFELLVNLVYAVIMRMLNMVTLVSIITLGGFLVVQSAIDFGSLNTSFNWNSFFGGFGRVTFSFFAGVLMHKLLPRWRLSGYSSLTCIAAAVLIFSIPKTPYRPLIDCAAVLVVFPVLTFCAATSEGSQRSQRVSVFLGRISYAVYTLHAPALWWMRGVFPKLAEGVQLTQRAPIAGLAALLLLALIAYFMDRHFDTPIRRMLMRRVRPPCAQPNARSDGISTT